MNRVPNCVQMRSCVTYSTSFLSCVILTLCLFTNNIHAIAQNESDYEKCIWKYFCLDRNTENKCIEYSQPVVICATQSSPNIFHIIDVPVKCNPGK